MQTLPWIVALATLALLVVGLVAWVLSARRPKKVAPLPTEWAVSYTHLTLPTNREV